MGSLKNTAVKLPQYSLTLFTRTVLSIPPEKHTTGSRMVFKGASNSAMIPFMMQYRR